MKKIWISTLFVTLAAVANAACNTDSWDVATASAKNIENGGIRYEGLCALDGSTGFVQQSIPKTTTIYYRFFVFVEKAQTNLTIFTLTDGINNANFVVDGSNFKFAGKTVAFNVGKWNSVRIHINAGNVSLAINDAPPLTGVTILSRGVTGMSLGKLGGSVNGKLYFDAFVASSNVIPENASVFLSEQGKSDILIPGDANGSGSIDTQDATLIMDEIKNNGNAAGVPDCTKDGVIDIRDAVCAVNKI